MRNITARIEATVKDELAKQCLALAINYKSDSGYAIGGGGVIAPIVAQGQIMGFSPTWVITIELRSLLLGQEPVAGNLPIHSVLPTDEEVRAIVARLVTDVANARDAQFRGDA